MPIVAMVIGKPGFSALTFTINNAGFRYGAFITAPITFVSTAAAIFFFVVKPANAMLARYGETRRGSDLRRGTPPPGAAGGEPRESLEERVEPDREAGWKVSHAVDGSQHARDECLARCRVVPDRQGLPRPAEEPLLVGNEAGQPDRVD